MSKGPKQGSQLLRGLPDAARGLPPVPACWGVVAKPHAHHLTYSTQGHNTEPSLCALLNTQSVAIHSTLQNKMLHAEHFRGTLASRHREMKAFGWHCTPAAWAAFHYPFFLPLLLPPFAFSRFLVKSRTSPNSGAGKSVMHSEYGRSSGVRIPCSMILVGTLIPYLANASRMDSTCCICCIRISEGTSCSTVRTGKICSNMKGLMGPDFFAGPFFPPGLGLSLPPAAAACFFLSPPFGRLPAAAASSSSSKLALAGSFPIPASMLGANIVFTLAVTSRLEFKNEVLRRAVGCV
mmetsp:Transcript_5964/g.11075  ORF Transcript_5964/g.11075 Transcript_5964/m.11075 type:complete len:293 (-) Transcript_5964:1724-2602(-)